MVTNAEHLLLPNISFFGSAIGFLKTEKATNNQVIPLVLQEMYNMS